MLGALPVLACSAEAPTKASVSAAGAELAKALSLHGAWRITGVNGAPTRTYASNAGERPSVEFQSGRYGGHSGCNSFGGHGLAIGDRWLAESPTATQQGCTDLEAQEQGIFSILAGGPTVTWKGPDAAELRTSAGGRLNLERTGPPSIDTGPSAPPMLLAGTRWELWASDGVRLMAAAGREPIRLSFEAERWTLDTPCGPRAGGWRQAEGAVVLQAGAVTTRSCSEHQVRTAEALTRTLVGELRYVVGPNGEFVLASAEHWATGQRDLKLGAEEPDLLSGRWRVTSVNGGTPPAGERPAEVALGPGFFGVWDGCRHSEGVAIALQRQLFTHGSGVVTAANCPESPVRTKINAVVTSSPRVARTAGGGLALVSRAGVLRLERTSSQPFGVGVQTRLRSGTAFDLPAGPGRGARLTLGPGDRFSLALSCTTIQGRWRNERSPWGDYARFGPDGPPPDCADSPDEEPLYGFFMGDVHAAIGPNRDIALFVSNGQSRPARVVAP
jgi:heat shock protein HslJ